MPTKEASLDLGTCFEVLKNYSTLAAKEMNPKMEVDRVFGPSFIDTMFRDYNPYLD